MQLWQQSNQVCLIRQKEHCVSFRPFRLAVVMQRGCTADIHPHQYAPCSSNVTGILELL